METITELSFSAQALGAFLGYLLVVILIGIMSSRFASEGISEFFIGGRKMHRFVVALSAVVSGRSAWLLLGVTGMAYTMGASAVWAVTGYIVAEMLLFLFYAPRLRRFSERYDCITVPDFFSARFQDSNGALRIIAVLIITLFMLSYVSAQFVAGGKAFSASFAMDPVQGILITAVIVLFYTMLGGFLAVSLTDVVQATFMLMALLLLPILAIVDRGGLVQVFHELGEIRLSLLDPFALSLGAFIGFLGIGLGSPGNPHIIARYMSIARPEQLRYSAIVGTIWNVVMAWGAIFIGLVGRVYFPEVSLIPGGDTENLYPILAQQHLQPVLFGMIIASIFAAIMSTADSQLLVAASAIVRDLYQKIIFPHRDIPAKKLVIYSRIVVILLVVASLGMGLLAQKQIFWLVLIAWAGLGAAFGPTSILALFWNKSTRAGVLSGMITGTVTTIIWYYTPSLKMIIYELVPAFILSTLITVLVSLKTRKAEQTDEFFRIMGGDL
ncbi:MAG: sodium/proline symporter [bacterium]|nr:MAG: sodium/proline symporter [bacterium]